MSEPLRALTCPQCGGTIEVRAAGLSVAVACRHCGSVLDVTRPDVALIQAYRRVSHAFALALGTRGTLEGIEWEVIGALRRRSPQSGDWQEFLLFNPYAGYRWLVLFEGDWQLGTMLMDRPELLGDGGVARWRNRLWTADTPEHAETVMVLGEFYWRVTRGDRCTATAHAGQGGTLSREEAEGEETWTHLVPVPARTIRAAFPVAGAAPDETLSHPPGAGASAFAQRIWGAPEAGTDPWRLFGIALAALVLIGLVQWVFAGPTRCSEGTARIETGALATTHRIGTITVSRPWQFVTVRAAASDFDNRWVDLDYTLVNEATQQGQDAYGLVEHYSGRDGDGPWTEGSLRAETQFAHVPRGTYGVYVEAAAHGWPVDPLPGAIDPANPWASSAVALAFTTCTGDTSGGMFWLMAVLLLSGPALLLWWRHRQA